MVIDKILSTVAPSLCLVCDKKGMSLCLACRQEYLESLPSRCYRCHKATRQFSVCRGCKKQTGLSRVWVVSSYDSVAKNMVEALKFGRNMSVASEIAQIMAEKLPIIDKQTIVCHVPTATKRIRVRGYDQSRLIAKSLSRDMGLSHGDLLIRKDSSRQLGASRKDRFAQAKKAYEYNSKHNVSGKSILLVDDVTTSGATLESIAKILKRNGAREVNAIVFAQAID